MSFEDVVAALHAAGDDAEALADAIALAEAAGLDGVPGEDRQKLRGEGLDAHSGVGGAEVRARPAGRRR